MKKHRPFDDASACPPNPAEIGDECAGIIFDLLSKHHLSSLLLSLNDLTSVCLERWALPAACHLTSLDVSSNDLGNKGAGEIARALAEPRFQLRILDVSNIAMDAAGAGVLAAALGSNNKLASLRLDDNDCAASLPQLVEACGAVRELSVRNTGLTDAVAKVAFSRIAVADTALVRVDARSNVLCSEVARVAARGLAKVKKGTEVLV